jgi:hypothetical protein
VPTNGRTTAFLRLYAALRRRSPEVTRAFWASVAALVEDLGDRGFDPTAVRPSLRLHKLSGENVWSLSFAGQYRAVFHLGEQQRPGHAHIVWEFIGSHAEYERQY